MRTATLLAALAAHVTLLALAPEAFSYQAVARDAGGDAVANTTVGVQFQVHQTTAAGTVVYAETHSPSTNELGLFTVEVGNGTPTTGTFAAIDWSTGPYFLEVGLDPAGGISYTSVGTQQLLSVPYALHARTADLAEDGDWVVNGDTLHSDGKQVGIGTAAPVRRLQVEDLLNGATIRPALKVKTHNCGVPCGQPETTQALSLQNENGAWGNVVGIGFSDNDADETPSAWMGARLEDKAQHHGDLLFHTRDGSGLHQRMIIERSGNVGIGTNTPSAKLEVNGDILASNMLSVEAFHGLLVNAADFTGSGSSADVNLEYTNVSQNSAPAVFSMGANGALTILKPGVIEVSAQCRVLTPNSTLTPFTRMDIRINGSYKTIAVGGGVVDVFSNVQGHLVWKVNAGDVLTITALPFLIQDLTNGEWSTLSVKWTGVNN
ncbi:MAG TPA: hypothetical protein PLF80_08105 [Flavobacteriales bacterium]|nr:hypothetical protein [Flavobacteriales bacterium]